MRVRGFSSAPLAALMVTLVVHTVVPGCRAAGADKQVPPQQQKRLEAMRAKGAEASLTIFPVVLWDTKETKAAGGMARDVGNVVGLMLEQSGMKNLEATDASFLLPADVDFDRAAELFGEFVRNNPIKTDYALYAEFVGRKGPSSRIDEVRAVVVDKAGDCVWIDRQTPDDRDFKRINPGEPMTCCVLLTERLRTQLGIPKSAKNDTGEGKFARMFAASSSAPDKAEWAAMEKRQAVMKKAGSGAKVAIFPVRLSDDEVGKNDAAHLATLLSKNKLCKAEVVDSPLRVAIKPARNEQKLLWDLARAFQDHVKKNPPEADYVLLADYMFPRPDRAWAVHFVVCDRSGEWVIVDYQNNHHGDFQSIDPKTHDDCGRLVAKRLRGYLR